MVVMVAVGLFIPCPSAFSGDNKVLTITSDDGPPYTLPDGSGSCDKLLRAAFGRIGYEVRIEIRPSERALKNVSDGIDDGNFLRISGLSKAYPNMLIVPEKLGDCKFVAFAKDKNLVVTKWTDLRESRVGYVLGWKLIEENVQGFTHLSAVRDQNILFGMLEKDRIDVALFDATAGQYWVKEHNASGIHTVGEPLAVREMYLYLNRKHKAILPPLAKAIRDVKEEEGVPVRSSDDSPDAKP
jgi:polar amino acid transport system substrate-binding protein